MYHSGNSTKCAVMTSMGRKFKKKESLGIHMADPLGCTPENNTTL